MKRSLLFFQHGFASDFRVPGYGPYGSRARGNATEESDLDVCVVVRNLDDAIARAIMEIAWQIGFKNDLVISTVTYSQQEFDEGPCSESPLVQNILNAGILA